MDLLQLLNTALVSVAASVGVYAVGRLFYVASTAPTNVRRKPGARSGTVLSATAWDRGERHYTIVLAEGNGNIDAGTILKSKTGYSEEPVK